MTTTSTGFHQNHVDNQFGNAHTIAKLDALRSYLNLYTQALKKQSFTLQYFDAFAGSGTCLIKHGGKQLRIPGSASIAMACEPPFHRLTFIEAHRRRADSLRRLAEQDQRGRITVIGEDANIALPNALSPLSRKRDRAVVLLDPFGMSVTWQTLTAVASTGVADLWYLFPLSGLYRQASRSADDIDSDKAAALTRVLGTEEWRTAFYAPPRQADMFATTQADERIVGPTQMADWVKERLATIFSAVAPPKILYQTLPSGAQGAPLFALFFAVSNDSKAAIGLAMKFAKHALKP